METREEKAQIGGCMAGFFNIFDRPHLLSPKRFALPRRLCPSSSPVLTAESEPASSAVDSGGIQKQQQSFYSNLPVMKFKQGSSSSSRSPWRFSKEAPRLSLDSRAVVGQIRHAVTEEESVGSPSVIARLMGLEALPSCSHSLQRSASESRVSSREYGFLDTFISSQNPSSIARAPPSPAPQRHRNSFLDFFPRHKCGFEAPNTTDLETLKQLLEALRLKGLLHSSTNRNLVHQSPIKPPPFGIRSQLSPPSGSPRRSRRSTGENSVVKTPNRRPTLKEQPQQQRTHSPLLSWRRRPEPLRTINPSGSFEDECFTTPPGSPEEMYWKVDEYHRQGKTLLERCDKLLHNIADMVESQPSPVSVLDASLYHEDSSPSPVIKRSLDFTATLLTETEQELLSMSSISSSDSEYVYISDILRASDCLPQESDIFSVLEKQRYLKGKRASGAAAQERRLIFDAVQEILGRIRRLPPWRMVAEADNMQVIWSEFQKIRMKRSSTEEKDDLAGYVCGVLGRDLSEDRWRDCQVEMSEAVLDIERLLFKDLIGETILHMAALKSSHSLRRRLLF
ncbi:hypothetical protein EUTSA_v10005863mg [Eutrema salsugineum]|uniref:DUF4378 domain-containing protein n=1 Tax=Eutrema salsugineum TaxID=72664 RepID=V4LV13_EUTSA|nr:uncharacterized protein LOC18020226 isoform X1 [Eutrema salsugineum]ESQ43728.1 hypothetical protein EUTSA_v10005863mg [Eutrema salsugineum]